MEWGEAICSLATHAGGEGVCVGGGVCGGGAAKAEEHIMQGTIHFSTHDVLTVKITHGGSNSLLTT